MKRCGWLRRWMHARLREIDRQTVVAALREQAERRYPSGDERRRKLVDALGAFMGAEGQGHWVCGCAEEDGINLIREMCTVAEADALMPCVVREGEPE